jgi:hypothetical protein
MTKPPDVWLASEVPAPDRIRTAAELSAALAALKGQRSYSHLTSAAGDLTTSVARQASGVQDWAPEALSRGTVSDWLSGRGRPTRAKLITFLVVCEVQSTQIPGWVEALERVKNSAAGDSPTATVRHAGSRRTLLGQRRPLALTGLGTGILGIATAIAVAATAASPPLDPGQICPLNVGATYPVEITRVRSYDGRPGISNDNIADIYIGSPAPEGHTYWLISKVTNGPGNYVYVAKDEVTYGPVPTGYPAHVRLPRSGPGASRDLFVVDGDPTNLTWLQANKMHDGDPSWDDPNRINLPPGVRPVSNVCTIIKTRTS